MWRFNTELIPTENSRQHEIPKQILPILCQETMYLWHWNNIYHQPEPKLETWKSLRNTLQNVSCQLLPSVTKTEWTLTLYQHLAEHDSDFDESELFSTVYTGIKRILRDAIKIVKHSNNINKKMTIYVSRISGEDSGRSTHPAQPANYVHLRRFASRNRPGISPIHAPVSFW